MTHRTFRPCMHEGCGGEAHARGMCAHHYRIDRRRHMPPCAAPHCDTPSYCGGLCTKHYMRKLRHGDVDTVLKSSGREGCDIPGCDAPHKARGLCQKHYAFCRYHGIEPSAEAVYEQEVARAVGVLKRYRGHFGGVSKEDMATLLEKRSA